MLMSMSANRLLLVLVAPAALACREPLAIRAVDHALPASEEILTFIESEGLHRVQRVHVLLDIPWEKTQVFRVVYGDSFPVFGLCERGCGYAFPVAIGLRRESHVGWLSVSDTTPRSRFDFAASDTYLYAENFFTRFGQADEILFQQPFKRLMATDPDTPDDGLWLLVRGLSTWISPSIATVLLDNANVAQNRAMLVAISRLPVFQGDAYKTARERAAAMLAAAP